MRSEVDDGLLGPVQRALEHASGSQQPRAACCGHGVRLVLSLTLCLYRRDAIIIGDSDERVSGARVVVVTITPVVVAGICIDAFLTLDAAAVGLSVLDPLLCFVTFVLQADIAVPVGAAVGAGLDVDVYR